MLWTANDSFSVNQNWMLRTVVFDHFDPTFGHKFAQEFAALEFALPVVEVDVVVQQRDSAPACGHLALGETKRAVPDFQARMARFQVHFQFVSISWNAFINRMSIR